MYKCLDCLEVFDEPKKYSEDCTPGGSFEGGNFMRYFKGCPYCAGAYEDADECDCCGKTVFTTDGELINGEFICKDCLKNKETEKDNLNGE